MTLPGGVWLNGVRQQEAVLRAPNGEDELWVQESRHARSFAWRVTALLARVLQRIGTISEVTPEVVAGLTVGDREALLLHVRRLIFGEHIHAVTRCPAAACGALMDLDLEIRNLLLPAYPIFQPEYQASIRTGPSRFRVRFRLPTGADQEAASRQPTLEAGATWIFQHAIRAITQDGKAVKTVPAEVQDKISARMAEVDPQAEILLKPACASCGAAFTSLFDTATYLFRELSARVPELVRDVHRLAFHYHWSESAIFALPWSRRRAYSSFLEQELLERRQ